MFSYWEQQSFINYDHIVVGAGIVGLSTAIEIKTASPDTNVLVCERGFLPTGASTKNAGFACMGSVTELLDDLSTMSEGEVLTLFEQRKEGLSILRNRLGDDNIGYKENGSYELINEEELYALEKIDFLNQLLLPINKQASFKLNNTKIKEFGFSTEHVKSVIENLCEGELHTGKMMKALLAYALQLGVEVKTGVEVQGFEEEADRVAIMVADPVSQHTITLSAHTLSICTNAFTKKLFPNADLKPGRGQVLITKPVDGLKFKGVFHFDKGYYYFRAIDGRVLIGGGRNLDFSAEETTTFNTSEVIQTHLEQKLREVILPDTSFEIDQRWAGIMAFGDSKQPVIQAFSNRVYGAFRMGGMGVAIGSEAGRALAHLIQSSH